MSFSNYYLLRYHFVALFFASFVLISSTIMVPTADHDGSFFRSRTLRLQQQIQPWAPVEVSEIRVLLTGATIPIRQHLISAVKQGSPPPIGPDKETEKEKEEEEESSIPGPHQAHRQESLVHEVGRHSLKSRI